MTDLIKVEYTATLDLKITEEEAKQLVKVFGDFPIALVNLGNSTALARLDALHNLNRANAGQDTVFSSIATLLKERRRITLHPFVMKMTIPPSYEYGTGGEE